MRDVVLTSGIALCLLTGAASAADLPTRKAPPAPPAPAVFSWTGFYIGADFGGAWDTSRAFYPVAGPAGYLPYNPTGIFGGLYGGYNYQFGGNWVIGLEGDINYGDVRRRDYYHAVPPIPQDTGVGDASWFGSGRVRIGYALDRFLPFVTGGVAVTEYQNSLFALSNPSFTGTYNHTEVGWTIGGGLDYAVTDNVVLRGEYRYADYGSVTDTLAANPLAVHHTSLQTNDVRIGLAYKF